MLKDHIYEILAIRQFDKQLDSYHSLKALSPEKGWINHLRNILKMPRSTLARFLKISPTALYGMEKREVCKTITLETLETCAEEMGCTLVYAFIPKVSIEDFVIQKRKSFINELLKKTNLSMGLENQGLDNQALLEQKTIIEEDLKSQPLSKFWKML